METHQSWEIEHEALLDDLITLMGLSDEEKNILAALNEPAKAQASHMVDAFYDRLLAHENTAEFLEGSIDRLRETLADWFAQLFSGDYNEDYVKSRLRIGQVHMNIGLPVRYPLAMMDVMLEHGEKVTAQGTDPAQATAAFRKLLALDIAIFNQAYESFQLKYLADLVGNEDLARRMLARQAK